MRRILLTVLFVVGLFPVHARPVDAAPSREDLAAVQRLWFAWIGWDPNDSCHWAPLIRREFDAAGFDGSYMVGIGWRESRCLEYVISRTNDHGLLQLHRPLHDGLQNRARCYQFLVAFCNVRMAVILAQDAERMFGDWRQPWRM